jgi:hypothetical protein
MKKEDFSILMIYLDVATLIKQLIATFMAPYGSMGVIFLQHNSNLFDHEQKNHYRIWRYRRTGWRACKGCSCRRQQRIFGSGSYPRYYFC